MKNKEIKDKRQKIKDKSKNTKVNLQKYLLNKGRATSTRNKLLSNYNQNTDYAEECNSGSVGRTLTGN